MKYQVTIICSDKALPYLLMAAQEANGVVDMVVMDDEPGKAPALPTAPTKKTGVRTRTPADLERYPRNGKKWSHEENLKLLMLMEAYPEDREFKPHEEPLSDELKRQPAAITNRRYLLKEFGLLTVKQYKKKVVAENMDISSRALKKMQEEKRS